MQPDSRCLRLIATFISATVGLAVAQAPPLQTTGVEVAASNERTALVRTTGNLASTVDVKVKNTGDRPLLPPLHAVITFTPLDGGNLAGLTMPGASGGLGKDPYQTFFKDLSAAIGEGLAPGAETTFNFTFERPQSLSVSYAVAIHCNRNRDPIAVIGGPYSGQQGVAVRLDASASSDPDGDALTFGWDFGDGTTATGPTPEHAYPSTGLFTVALTVTDARGAAVTRETQVPIAPAGVFALARTRTLDGNGHPLGEVTISQSGPAGEQTFRSDAVSGFASLGGTPGIHSWRFTRSGHLTSYRTTTLTQGQVKVVAFPWLAALSTQRTPLSLLNPTVVKSPAERVALTFLPEAFEQAESVAITELDGQTLPLPLPVGWSPLAAFHVDLPGEAAVDVAASLRLLQAAAVAQPLALVRLDENAPAWQTAALLSGSGGDRVAAVLRKPGTYAVVLADTLPAGNPAVAVPGEPLPAGNAPEIAAEIAAIGLVNPGENPASLDPARVTAEATVDFTNGAQPLASGAWFRAEVEETYDLTDGRALKTPDYDATFYAYQHPGDASPVTATAKFPLRPRILFGPEELTEAHIKVEILALSQFSGGILTPAGGSLALGGVRIGVPAGAVAGPAAAEIRLLPTANLGRFLGGFEALLAFELNLPALADGTVLDTVFAEILAPDSHFVLARCVLSGSESGLQPVLRLRSDSQGVVTSQEPASGPRLPGITGSGQFVIVRIAAPEALITGLVRNAGGAPLPGAQVRVGGEPWLSLTGGAGTFFTLAQPGERTVVGSDPADGNSGEAPASLADAAATAHVEIQTAPTGPRVVATTPAANDLKASPVTPIQVEFSEPILPGSFGATGIRLRDVAADADVPGSLSLDPSNRKASLLPANPLEPGKTYQILVSPAVQDVHNQPIEGTLTFSFETAPRTVRSAGAQLVIYEPGAEKVPPEVLSQLVGYRDGQTSSDVVVVGTAGTGDPGVPIILVNESTGETATVLSKPDGSFATFIHAAEDDFVAAVFVNANGTRVTVPATRQLFDDGRVGLYHQGGVLEASNEEAGQVQVIVKPGSIPSRAVFKLDVLTLAATVAQLGGLEPAGDAKVVGGINLTSEGDPTDEITVQVGIPFDDLGIADLSELADQQVLLTTPHEVDGVRVFNTRAIPQVPENAGAAGLPEPSGILQSTPVPAVTNETTSSEGEAPADLTAGAPEQETSPSPVAFGGEAIASFAYELTGDINGFSSFVKLAGGVKLSIPGSVSAVSGRGLVSGPDGQLRVPGAFVFPGEVDATGAPKLDSNGKPVIPPLGTGQIGSVSNATNGGFILSVPVPTAEAKPFVFAVSSLFPSQVAIGPAQIIGDGALSQVARKAFPQFAALPLSVATDRVRPRILASFNPLGPANLVPFNLRIAASDFESASPPSIKVRLNNYFPSSLDHIGETAEGNLTFTKISDVETGTTREQTWRILSKLPALVDFIIEATDSSGNLEINRAVVEINERVLTGAGGAGPLVISTQPQSGAFDVRHSQPVRIRFSAPIDPETLIFIQSMFSVPVINYRLEDQNRELIVILDSSGASSVDVNIPGMIQDIAGNYFDQDPLTEENDSHTFSFRYKAPEQVRYSVSAAGGIVGDAKHQFVLERADSRDGSAYLRCFSSETGQPLAQVGQLALPEFPRDLIDLGFYAFEKSADDTPVEFRPSGVAAGSTIRGRVEQILHDEGTYLVQGEAFAVVRVLNSSGQATAIQHIARAPVTGTLTSLSVLEGVEINLGQQIAVIATRPNARLIAVVGGLAGIGQDSWIQIINVTDPATPRLLAATTLGLGGTTLPVKLAWSPPRLGVLLLGAEQTSILELDLPLLVLASRAPDYSGFSATGTTGTDLNGDGDYADAGEIFPEPIGAAPKFGVINGGAVETSVLNAADSLVHRIADFDMAVGAQYMVACSRHLGPAGDHRFWLLKLPGVDVNDADSAVLSLSLAAEPTRIKLLLGLQVEVPQPDQSTLPGTRDLALVSLNNGTVAVIDLTDRPSAVLRNTLQIPQADGLPKSFVLGADGLLYLSCAKNLLVLDPKLLLAPTSVGATASDLSKTLIHRIPDIGTGARAFVASNINHVATALNNRSFLSGESLPPPPAIIDLQAESVAKVLGEPRSPTAIDLAISLAATPAIAASLQTALDPPLKTVRRKSKEGLLEIVDPTPVLGTIIGDTQRFDPIVTLRASEEPRGTPVEDFFPLWKKKGPEDSAFTRMEAGHFSQTAPITGYNRAREAVIKAAAATSTVIGDVTVPTGPIIAFVALANSQPDVWKFECENKQATINVYSGLSVTAKIDTAIAEAAMTKSLAPLNAFLDQIRPGFKVSLSSKGVLGMTGQWKELSEGNQAYFGFDASAGFDPLIGLAMEFPISSPQTVPIELFFKRVVRTEVGLFGKLGGSVSLQGIGIQRTELPDKTVGIQFLSQRALQGTGTYLGGGATLSGAVTLGLEARIKTLTPAPLFAFSLAAETGMGISGTYNPSTPDTLTQIKDFTVSSSGLTVTASVTFPGGTLLPSLSAGVAVLPPATILKKDIDLAN